MTKVASLAARSVSAAYDETPVVSGVSCEFERGRLYAVLGPNGAGKSTLLNVLTGVMKPSGGEVLVNGDKLSRLRQKEIARRISTVRQNSYVAFDFTVEEVVRMGRYSHESAFRTEGESGTRIVRDAIERTGLTQLAGRSILELSGGERQRVFIARALAQSAEIMLLDEPVSNLDIKYQLDILDLLRSLSHDGGMCVVCVVHDLELAANYADEALLMSAGGIVYRSGPVADVLTEEHIAEVFGVAVKIARGDDGVVITPRRFGVAQ